MTFPASEGGEAERIRARLAGLAEERASLEARLAELEADRPAAPDEGAATGSPALERSRSGNGGHVRIFFADAVPAALARRLGTHLLTEAMARRPDIGFGSYDRFFPSQDTVPEGGLGL